MAFHVLVTSRYTDVMASATAWSCAANVLARNRNRSGTDVAASTMSR
jgi:hypothetical protein